MNEELKSTSQRQDLAKSGNTLDTFSYDEKMKTLVIF
jgi:hypothetical protein